MTRTPDPEQLMDEAYECLDSFDVKKALSIGKTLVQMRYSGGFEIIALAYAQDDKLDKAIKTLEDGVKKCPTVWLLWQLLGNYYSDDHRYDNAMEAYRKALSCPDSDPSSIHLNIAISLMRQGKYNESNQELLLVDSPEMLPPREAVRLGNYISLSRYDDVITEAPKIIEKLDWEADEDRYQQIKNDLSAIYASLGTALLDGAKDRDKAREAAFSALQHNKLNERALSIVRELRAEQTTNQDSLFRLVVEGQWNEPFQGEAELPNFYTNYWVVASSQEEALNFARELERPEVAESLRVDEIEQEKIEDWQTLKGVYSRSGYAFYMEDDEEEAGE